MEISKELSELYKKEIEPSYKTFEYSKKKMLLKLFKYNVFDKLMYLRMLKIQKVN